MGVPKRSILQDFTIYKTNNIMKKKWAWWFWATSNGYTNRDKLKKNVKWKTIDNIAVEPPDNHDFTSLVGLLWRNFQFRFHINNTNGH